MSVYRTAIDQTMIVIDQRSRIFRNQVVAVVTITSGSVAGALMLHRVWPMAVLLVLFPACGLFFWLDTKRVVDWRSSILQMQVRRDICLMAFREAMRAVPNLPETTLTGMLNLLGTAQIGQIETQASVQTRQTVAAVVQFADTLALRQLAAKACAAAIVSVGVCWAAAMQTWQPLGLVAVALLLPLALRWLTVSLQRQSRAAVLAARQQPDFEADAFSLLIEQFPLGGGQFAGDGWIDAAAADK